MSQISLKSFLHHRHKCKGHKRTLFSHKEILLVFALIGVLNIPRTGCDDTENFQKNSEYINLNYSSSIFIFFCRVIIITIIYLARFFRKDNPSSSLLIKVYIHIEFNHCCCYYYYYWGGGVDVKCEGRS